MWTAVKIVIGVMVFVIITAFWIGTMVSRTANDTVQPPTPAKPKPVVPTVRPAPKVVLPPPAPACKLEGWRWKSFQGFVTIEGTTSCPTGRIDIRLYDRQKFLGVATGYVRAHAFTAMATDIRAPKTLTIKYAIEPR